MLTWGTLKQLQLWTLVTNFFFVGKFSFNFIILMFWILHYGKELEMSTYQHNTADYLYMYFIGMVTMNIVAVVIPFFRIGFCASSLIFMLAYVWSKNFATQDVSLYGLLTIQGFYLPFALLAFSVMVGGNWVADVLGILGGHMYYFLKVIHPAAGGAALAETPVWMHRFVYWLGIGTVPLQATNPTNPTNPAFRAFRGGGRRLGDG